MRKAMEFEHNLVALCPQDDDFVLRVDALIEAFTEVPVDDLVPSIFRFFERHPLEDCGAPGALVHLVETSYPRYKSTLLQSLQESPSLSAILMVNRILNSVLSWEEREEYLSALHNVAVRPEVHADLKSEAEHFIQYQANKSIQ